MDVDGGESSGTVHSGMAAGVGVRREPFLAAERREREGRASAQPFASPKLRGLWTRLWGLIWGFVVQWAGVFGYLSVCGMVWPMSSKALRWIGVGVATRSKPID